MMNLPKYFVCHGGSDIKNPDRKIGILGMVYRWDGNWHDDRSPKDVEDRDKNPVMVLKELYGEENEVWGDVGCFTEIGVIEPLEE